MCVYVFGFVFQYVCKMNSIRVHLVCFQLDRPRKFLPNCAVCMEPYIIEVASDTEPGRFDDLSKGMTETTNKCVNEEQKEKIVFVYCIRQCAIAECLDM